ncbi:hypothetical protein ISS07_04360 [Candidatus Woesearchaeota archaeon]|nr:hypothetical protein [Candidatus Woesearchaeota archaeon]
MMEQKPFHKTRNGIIAIAIILSLVLYFSGVFSGLYANSILKAETKQDINKLEEKTKQDIISLKQETEEYLQELEEYISFLDNNLRDMQLQQTFIDTLTEKQQCDFSRISFNELISKLGFYWEKLPYRIEEYEKYNVPSEEYTTLKEQYSQLSIQIWSLAKKLNEQCNIDLVHGLHFYSGECEQCIEQGVQLDELNRNILEQGKEIIMFPVDFNSKNSVIKNLKKYYEINTTPALIVNNEVFQGNLFSAEEILSKI